MDTHPLSPQPLELRGVTKRYGEFTAVSDVSLTIQTGEIFALLGPNGAGKTTVISCIAGLSRQTSGHISVFGHDTITGFRESRRLLGLVPQEINFDPFFTPYESLMIQMGFMGVRPDGAWADTLLRTFSLFDKRDAYTRQLSGGMKRRLLVAKALVHKPRLLFLDEPTAGVDVELRQSLWREVRRLRDSGTTVVLTTHYLDEAEELADRVGIVSRGKLLLVENTQDLLRAHRRNTATITVPGNAARVAQALGESAAAQDADRVVFPYPDANVLADRLAQARALGSISDVALHPTSLEDVFLTLTGGQEPA